MVHKSYDSVEYYTQTFRDCLDNFLSKFGGQYLIKHSSNTVFFKINNITSHLYFRKESELPYISLELSLINGQDIERKEVFERKLNPKRSKQGRISGYPNIAEKFVLANIKKFHNKYQKLNSK
tara:strand:+ start:4544 stop:4912 length:369 start_codon:yes stop_codon:yes gene_type:complete